MTSAANSTTTAPNWRNITKPELGCALITRDGQEFELKAQGWNPLKEETTESEGEKAGE